MQKILDFYLQFSLFTYSGLYQPYLKSLPENMEEIGLLVRKQFIHRMTLKNGNTGSNKDLRYGDMNKIPWYRQAEDDLFPTASAMIAELFRRDSKGFILDRATEDKLVLTCRFTAILMASILKSKGIPARARSGFAPYFKVDGLPGGTSDDHWVNQYWSKNDSRWITIDVDGCLEPNLKFDPFDMPKGSFDFAADAWLDVRSGKVKGKHFWNASGYSGIRMVVVGLFNDFHCLMNSEKLYLHYPKLVHYKEFKNLTEEKLKEIDDLARLMQDPDKNFDALKKIWETSKDFRLLNGILL